METTNVPANAPAKQSISNFLNVPATQKFLESNLEEKKGEFVSNLIAMCESDSNLAKCNPKDLMMCAMNAVSLGLPLNKNLGFAYVIPYNGVPSFQIGYKGFVQMAIKTGMYETINACAVREGEITRNKITGDIKYNGDKPDKKVVGYLAYLKMLTGFTASLYMSEEEVESHALRFSKMYQTDKRKGTAISKWSDPASRAKMAMKTVLKGLLGTYGVLTTEMARAMEADNEIEDSGSGQRFTEYEEVESQPEPTEDANQAQPTQQPAAPADGLFQQNGKIQI